MDITLFHNKADIVLQHIVEVIEESDKEYSLEIDFFNGILTITLPSQHAYVINKHEASRQIWLSSPQSGAHHFAHQPEKDSWLDSKGKSLYSLLSEEFKHAANITFSFT